MKTIVEYINESLRLDEAKKVKIQDVLKGLDKIDEWNKPENIKKLMSEYMSAGDAEDLKKEHWDTCVEIVDYIGQLIADDLTGGTGVIDTESLTNLVTDRIEDSGFEDDVNSSDKEGDWDVDEMINLFNTVSMKVCKEVWLI